MDAGVELSVGFQPSRQPPRALSRALRKPAASTLLGSSATSELVEKPEQGMPWSSSRSPC
ncbi:hypothetical protein E2562_028489 [Oryza meyeriana var. granulata]|uniref:Uncharacterized protein n=1 Tax=Oryza meyeriana var. granulata TaxID=110450 RepID=A0A6G1DPF7_9ORYZ|nr:hypothetical protein E2562_028489 [Oryza meyeriana var. granulata]